LAFYKLHADGWQSLSIQNAFIWNVIKYNGDIAKYQSVGYC